VAEVAGRMVFSTPKTHQSRTVPDSALPRRRAGSVGCREGPSGSALIGVKGAVSAGPLAARC
jgi:hypothetical protein